MFTAVIYSQNPYLNIAISILPWWGFEMFWLGTSLNTSHVRLSSSLYSICFFKTCVPVTVNQIIGKWNVYSVTSMLLNLRISTTGALIRTLFVELSRVLNHLLAVTTTRPVITAFTFSGTLAEWNYQLSNYPSYGIVHQGSLPKYSPSIDC